MRIEEILNPGLVTVRSADNVRRAAQLMWEQRCGAVAVVDEHNTLVGILSDRDICMGAYTQGKPLEHVRVSSAMAKPVFSCSKDDSVEEAARTMRDHKVRQVPIVNNRRQPVGMLSISDLFRASVDKSSSGIDTRALIQTMASFAPDRQRSASASMQSPGTQPAKSAPRPRA